MTATTSTSRIDASCRLPLFTLFGGAATWLVLSSVFSLVASLKFHAPAMFADQAWLSYGRAYPAWSHLLVYGFCVPAGLGVCLWLLARLGQVELARPLLITFFAKLWHLGVLVGLIAILAGQTTGYEWFELPRYAAVILFIAFVMITVWAFVTYSQRTVEALYPSQWFILAALFWFPWIFSTATLLLQFFPVRGVVQAAVNWWYVGNLLNVWLTLVGLASAFYLLPKLTGRPLHSYYLALFAFLTVILFGTWTGIPNHAALPAWMPALSSAASLLSLIPALAVATIVILTGRGTPVSRNGGPLCFTKLGAWALVLATVLLALSTSPGVARVTDYTWFTHGQTSLRIYGFFGMTMLGAIYHILPHVVGTNRIAAGRMRINFWLFMVGTVIFALPLMAGGIAQGLKLANPDVAFLDAAKAAMMGFRLSTLGELLLLAANLVFLFNIVSAIVSYYRVLCRSAYEEATEQLEPVGVKP
ncbi:MAG TPA: cbb3-type cytochrome c oxidase subunit I [Verrucomicrobiae bacterium]|nr:cbb3-type cytochrome c oxidase subunit I [Verrucomicrobiae bacterium]